MSDDIQTGIHVSIRARPLNAEEIEQDLKIVVNPGLERGSLSLDSDPRTHDSLAVKHYTAKNYQLDSYFGPEDDTNYIYGSTAANLVPHLMEGFNCSVFCYGPTGTGKTFTMFGNEEQPGISRNILRDLLEAEKPGFNDKCLTLTAVEIYGNDCLDLLSEKRSQSRGPSSSNCNRIQIATDEYGNVRLCGVTRHKIETFAQALELIKRAKSRRITHSTNANQTSSRSHCVIQLQMTLRGNWGQTQISKMNLVDLAGSERVHQTGLTMGDRMTEACAINYSLLALKKCISGLAKNKNFIPFRDSKLTQLLQDCLQGNCLTYIIACISPAESQWQSTKDTLEYSTQARAIKLSAKRQYRSTMGLHEQVQFLKQQNQTLISRIREFEKEESKAEIFRKGLERDFRQKELEMQHDLERIRREHLEWIRKQDEILRRREQVLSQTFRSKELQMRAEIERKAFNMVDIDEEKNKIIEFKEELRVRATGMQCVVCIDRPASHAFLPCGHRCICEKCSVHMKREWHGGKRCPMCKKKAKSVLQIYM